MEDEKNGKEESEMMEMDRGRDVVKEREEGDE